MREGDSSKVTPADDHAGICPSCYRGKGADFFVSRRVPVDVGSTLASETDALAAPLADIILAHCHRCGLTWNRTFNSSQIAFKPGYDAGLHHSPLVQSFVNGMVDRLIGRFDLRGKKILEIGCGDGYFLKRLCERGGNSGTGIDPTVPRVGIEQAGLGRVQFIRDFYSKRYSGLPCDFICCQSVLEDIPSPLAFLTNVRDIIGKQALAAYFEVFNAGRAFEQQETWSIHYEQCNYFSLETFRDLCRRSGFEVLDAGACPGNDQYIFVEAKASNGRPALPDEPPIGQELLPPMLSNFAARHTASIEKWRNTLSECRLRAQKVVLWGSGGKGVSFLNALGSNSRIRYVVDINPSRHGRYVPRSAQQIVPPAFLIEYRPDVVILSNPAYESEIRQEIASIGLRPDVWLV